MSLIFSLYCSRDAKFCVSTCFQKYAFLLIISIMCILFPSWAQTESTPSFSFCPDAPIVKDHEGNRYRTVQIGTQCWMAENMRCSTSPTGKHWLYNPRFTAMQPLYAAYYAMPTNSRNGLLYSWAAAIDRNDHVKSGKSLSKPVRGICPEGWHLPDNEEWGKLFMTLGGTAVAGEMMKAPTKQWQPHLVIKKEYLAGFEASPAGAYTEEGCQYAGYQAYFWSSDNFSRDEAWSCIIYDYKNEGYNYLGYKCYGHSVRCVKDE